jgi:hypothetical protein
LQTGIQLVEFMDNLTVEVKYTAVQLVKTLNDLRGNITATNQVFEQTRANPFGILYITLPAGKLFDEVRINQFQFKVTLKNTSERNPVNVGALHTHLTHTVRH